MKTFGLGFKGIKSTLGQEFDAKSVPIVFKYSLRYFEVSIVSCRGSLRGILFHPGKRCDGYYSTLRNSAMNFILPRVTL